LKKELRAQAEEKVSKRKKFTAAETDSLSLRTKKGNHA
jgi:hypothetical protein